MKKAILLAIPLLSLVGTSAFAGGAPLPPPSPSPTPVGQDVMLPQAVLDAIGNMLVSLSATFAAESQEVAAEQAFINSAGLEISGMIATIVNLRTQPMDTLEQRQAIAAQLQPIIQRISEISTRLSAIINANNQRRAVIQQMISVLIQLSNLLSVAA